jgi:hypothetical protein
LATKPQAGIGAPTDDLICINEAEASAVNTVMSHRAR